MQSADVKIKSDLFKQTYHLLCLNYWILIKVLLKTMKESKNLECFTEVQHLNVLLTKLIPNSIKRFFHLKSVCLTNNVYAGFDTEYKQVDQQTNKILSVQVSVNSCYTLKIPTLQDKHVFGSLDVNTNKFYEIKHNSKLINYELIDSIIQSTLDFKTSLSPEYKRYIEFIINTLKSKGLKCFIKDNFYYFKMPSTNIITKFIEIKNSFSMKDLIKTVVELDQLNLVKKDMNLYLSELLGSSKDFSNSISENFPEVVYTELNTETIYDSVFDSNEVAAELGVSTQKGSFQKHLKSDKFEFFTENAIYLTAHYNAADLSMLSNFEMVDNARSLLFKIFK